MRNIIESTIRLLLHAALIYFLWRWNNVSEWSGLKEIPWGISIFFAIVIDMFRVERIEIKKDE